MIKYMPRMSAIIIILTLVVTTTAWSQGTVSVMETSRLVDPARYDEIKGSPYMYEEWYNAKIIGSDGKIYDDVKVNFNGLTRQLEIKKNDNVSQMNGASYIKVIVHTKTGDDAFLRGLHPELGANIICVSYDGQRIKLLKKFSVHKQKTEVQTPMHPTVFEKFVPSSEYFLMMGGTLSAIRFKKKKIISVLGYKVEIEAYLKQEKLNLSSEQNLIQLLKHYESVLIQ